MDERVSTRDLIESREPRTRTRRSRWRLLTVAVAICLLAVLGFALYRTFAPSGRPAPQSGARQAGGSPQPVGAATIARGDIRVVLSALGTVTPLATVTVKTQINGQLTQVAFKEGQLVGKGDFLAQIDPRPYEVSLEQAEGASARDQALLKNAQLDLQRYQTLLKQDSISRQQLDTQASLVQQYVGTVKTDQAAIDTAKLNLVYCHITAPEAGRVGLRQVDEGNYVQTSDSNGIVVITQLQPISVIFTLPEDDVPDVLAAAPNGTGLQVTAFDRSDSHQIAAGRLETIDNQIDTTTGTVKLRAIFDNAKNELFPSQFVNAKLLVKTLQGVVVAPSAAIQRGEPGTFVYTIKPDNTVHVQVVKLGPGDGDKVAIESGLDAGDRVVTDGTDRLREGVRVIIPASNGAAPGQDASGPARPSGQDQHRQGERRRRQDGQGQP